MSSADFVQPGKPDPRAGANQAKGERFLRKNERKACWEARDQFWECMRKSGEDANKCKVTRESFQSLCPATWVDHFDRKFQYEKFKVKLKEEGFQAADERFTSQKQGQGKA